jgi:hypothetical protein
VTFRAVPGWSMCPPLLRVEKSIHHSAHRRIKIIPAILDLRVEYRAHDETELAGLAVSG